MSFLSGDFSYTFSDVQSSFGTQSSFDFLFVITAFFVGFCFCFIVMVVVGWLVGFKEIHIQIKALSPKCTHSSGHIAGATDKGS